MPALRGAADELLGGLVHVVDEAVAIRRDDAFADRLERDARLQLAAAERRLETLAMRDVARHGHERRLAAERQAPAVQLRPQPLVVVADELDLERRQRLAALGAGADVLAHPGAVRGTQEVGDRLADQGVGLDAEQLARRAIRVEDRLRMNQRDLGQRVGQRVEQLAAIVRQRIFELRGDARRLVAAIEQAVHRCGDVDESAEPAVDGDALRLLAERQQVVQILAEPLDLSDVRSTRPGPDERAAEQEHDESCEHHDRVGEELRHAHPSSPRRVQRTPALGE